MKETKASAGLKPGAPGTLAKRRSRGRWWLAAAFAVVAVGAFGYWGVAKAREAAYLEIGRAHV